MCSLTVMVGGRERHTCSSAAPFSAPGAGEGAKDSSSQDPSGAGWGQMSRRPPAAPPQVLQRGALPFPRQGKGQRQGRAERRAGRGRPPTCPHTPLLRSRIPVSNALHGLPPLRAREGAEAAMQSSDRYLIPSGGALIPLIGENPKRHAVVKRPVKTYAKGQTARALRLQARALPRSAGPPSTAAQPPADPPLPAALVKKLRDIVESYEEVQRLHRQTPDSAPNVLTIAEEPPPCRPQSLPGPLRTRSAMDWEGLQSDVRPSQVHHLSSSLVTPVRSAVFHHCHPPLPPPSPSVRGHRRVRRACK